MKKYIFAITTHTPFSMDEERMEIIVDAEDCSQAFDKMKAVLKQFFEEKDYSMHVRFVYSEEIKNDIK